MAQWKRSCSVGAVHGASAELSLLSELPGSGVDLSPSPVLPAVPALSAPSWPSHQELLCACVFAYY